MADVFFDNPPILRGQAEEQLQQLYSYLGIISNQLNEALMTISIDQMTPETQTVTTLVRRSPTTLRALTLRLV